MADLFLSYSPKDAETARKIAQELERRGSSIYYQRPEELDNSQLQTLDHEMSIASWVIVLWSGHALQDGRITYEAMHASSKNNLLSVQIEPNSIPAEYNNDHSPDHVSYQNQLTGIIQQALSPVPVPAPSLTEQPAPQQQQGSEQEDTAQLPQQGVETKSDQTLEQVVPQQDTPQETASTTSSQPLDQAATQQSKTNQPQNGPVETRQENPDNTPKPNLQQKLAEKTKASQPAKENTPAENKIGQPPAPKAEAGLASKAPKKRVLTPLPTQNTAKNLGAVADVPKQTIAPATIAATENTAKSSKFIPIALMSIGTLLLGSVGAGYWYLTNNKPDLVISKVTKLIKSDPTPTKVAINKVSPPQIQDTPQQNTPAPNQKKGIVSTENDPLLSSILNKFPSEEKTEPAAPAPSEQKAVANGNNDMAKDMVIQASTRRGEKSISQCSGCHSFTQNGPNKSGPNLYGVMNQLIGSERKFNYSDTLRSMGAIGEVWNKDQLDCYLKNPAVCMPGTKMGFNGIKSHRKRTDIIAYLKSLQN